MATQREIQKEKTTQAMLDAALKVFAEKGYSAARLSDIAEEADVAKGLINTRFGSKEELFNSLVEEQSNLFVEKIKYHSGLRDILVKIAEEVISCAGNSSYDSIFRVNIIRQNDVPESTDSFIKQKFIMSPLYELINEARSQGVVNDTEPYELIRSYFTSILGIAVSYIHAGIALPAPEKFLKLVIPSEQNDEEDEDFTMAVEDKKITSDDEVQNSVLASLFINYESVITIDVRSHKFKTFRNLSRFKLSDGEYADYDEIAVKYANECVYEADRERYILTSSIDFLLEQLKDSNSFAIEYRDIRRKIPMFSEMKFFVLARNSDGVPSSIAAGSIVRDEEICRKNVDKTLYSDFESVFFVDIENDAIRTISSSEKIKNSFSKISVYSEFMKSYLNTIEKEYRETWAKMSDPSYMEKFLAAEDRREYVYNVLPNSEFWNKSLNNWRRSVFRVVERRNGIPVSFVLTLTAIDVSSAKKYELDKKIAEQKQVLESQTALLEEALQRAEKASRAKTSFLTNMSHDIRTPMNAIMGFTNLALENIENPEKVQKFLSKAAVSSKHLLSLINDIIDMSRIESGKLQLEESACSLEEIMRELSTIMHGQAETKQQSFVVDYSAVTNTKVICDKLRLHQVLTNVVGNAIKFTPVGGSVYAFVHQTSATDKTASYEFHVKDNGIGMSSDFVDKLFEPFERERTSTISRTTGSGLGLSISKNIVDMMGGSIKIQTETGKGTEVIIFLTLKLQKKLTVEQRLEEIDRFDFTGKKVLLVDDNPYNVDIALELLQEKGFIVDVAENGRDAVTKVKNYLPKRYDTILMDIQMPVMNGYEATKEIRKISGLGKDELPVIAMTANAFAEDRMAAFNAGMNAHLVKPVVIEEMYKVLSEFVRG